MDIWACGNMYGYGLKLAEILKSKGINTGLVCVEIVKPLDLGPYDKNVPLLITLEDNDVSGGFGVHLAAELSGENTEVISFGCPAKFVEQGSSDELADLYGLRPEQIAERICEHIEGKA